MYENKGANDKKRIDEALIFWYINNNKSETQFYKCTM